MPCPSLSHRLLAAKQRAALCPPLRRPIPQSSDKFSHCARRDLAGARNATGKEGTVGGGEGWKVSGGKGAWHGPSAAFAAR